MKHKASLAALAPLTLGACATLFGSGSPFAFDKKGDLVEFNYSWSAEASRTPSLVRRLQGDLERAFKAAVATAEADRAQSAAMKRPFNGHQYSRRWTSAGQSPRLLSLDGRLMLSTGGAHPSHGADGLLWDRLTGTEVKIDRLFGASTALEKLVHSSFCVTLDGERAKRRGAQMRPGDAFSECPRLDAIAVFPADSNANRRFDRFRLIAPNGVAGAYAEGAYDIAVPVTAAMRAALKPAYRSSFEVAQPQ